MGDMKSWRLVAFPVAVLTLLTTLALGLACLPGNGFAGRPLDAVVLWLYLAVIHGAFFLSVALFTLAVVHLTVGTAGRMRAWIAGSGAGAIVALNSVLAWPVTYGPFNSIQPFVTPVGLWSALVFLMAPAVVGALAAGWPTRRRKVLLLSAGWILAFLTTFAFHLHDTRPGPSDLERPRPVAGENPAGADMAGEASRLLVVGFDGLAWDVLLPLIKSGDLPHFADLLRRGACGDLRTLVPTLSPAIWTTIATGHEPADHGIHTFGKFRLRGMSAPLVRGPALSTPNWWNGLNRVLLALRERGWAESEPYLSDERRVPAIWDVADHDGLTTGMAGWLAGWPVAPPASGGFRVADFRAVPGALAPAGEETERLLASASSAPPLLPLPDDINRGFYEGLWAKAHREVFGAAALLEHHAPRFAALYFHFPDPVLHMRWRGERFLITGAPEKWPADVVLSYRLTDRFLGTLLAATAPGTTVFVVSDHGFAFDGRQHHHAPPGILLAAGPDVRPGVIVRDTSIYDLFPTWAAFLDLPIASALPGRVLEEVFVPGSLPPRRQVASYDWYDPAARPRAERSPEVEEAERRRLRALGYVN